MERHIVLGAGCSVSLTEKNIDNITKSIKRDLTAHTMAGAKQLSGLFVVGDNDDAAKDMADVLCTIAKNAYKNAKIDDYNEADELAFHLFNAWLIVGLRDLVKETRNQH